MECFYDPNTDVSITGYFIVISKIFSVRGCLNDPNAVVKYLHAHLRRGVKNKNTHNTQINLNKQKLGEP